MTDLQQLRQKVNAIIHPSSMKKINGEIAGLAFFPGGSGLVGGTTKIADRPIMVLGQDFDTEKGFSRSKAKGNEAHTPTWINLKALFAQADIDLADCFFTNCILGVRTNESSNVGKSPAIYDPVFLKQCLELLAFQINLQRPKGIICLGLIPLKLLCYLSKELHLVHIGLDTFKEIDQSRMSVCKEVEIQGIKDFHMTVIALTHPSYRKLNAHRRHYKHFKGDRAEIEMLKELK